jgi:GMP synthase (glutamine-hydrolysing)
MPCTTKIKDIKFKPKGRNSSVFVLPLLSNFAPGIILSGSPYSVYDNVSPHADPAIYDLGVPILGICYGLQVTHEHASKYSALTI